MQLDPTGYLCNVFEDIFLHPSSTRVLLILVSNSPTPAARPAFCFDSELALIRAETLNLRAYLRIRRGTRRLARASRRQLLDAYAYADRAINVSAVHAFAY